MSPNFENNNHGYSPDSTIKLQKDVTPVHPADLNSSHAKTMPIPRDVRVFATQPKIEKDNTPLKTLLDSIKAKIKLPKEELAKLNPLQRRALYLEAYQGLLHILHLGIIKHALRQEKTEVETARKLESLQVESALKESGFSQVMEEVESALGIQVSRAA